jgi:hypothetical protein
MAVHCSPLFSLPFSPISIFKFRLELFHARPDLTMPKRKQLADSERQTLAGRLKPKSSMSSMPDAEDSDAVKTMVHPAGAPLPSPLFQI